MAEQKRGRGHPKAFSSPDELWQLFCEHRDYITNNPWIKYEAIKGGDMCGQLVAIPTALPLTWDGFEVWLKEKGVISSLDRYKANTNGEYNEYCYIITHIGKIIYDFKFKGACVGAFNASIIAKDLGLIEKKQIDQNNTNIEPITGMIIK